jgi:hypothetical protein
VGTLIQGKPLVVEIGQRTEDIDPFRPLEKIFPEGAPPGWRLHRNVPADLNGLAMYLDENLATFRSFPSLHWPYTKATTQTISGKEVTIRAPDPVWVGYRMHDGGLALINAFCWLDAHRHFKGRPEQPANIETEAHMDHVLSSLAHYVHNLCEQTASPIIMQLNSANRRGGRNEAHPGLGQFAKQKKAQDPNRTWNEIADDYHESHPNQSRPTKAQVSSAARYYESKQPNADSRAHADGYRGS